MDKKTLIVILVSFIMGAAVSRSISPIKEDYKNVIKSEEVKITSESENIKKDEKKKVTTTKPDGTVIVEETEIKDVIDKNKKDELNKILFSQTEYTKSYSNKNNVWSKFDSNTDFEVGYKRKITQGEVFGMEFYSAGGALYRKKQIFKEKNEEINIFFEIGVDF